jgi:hypothetical protein
MARNLTTLQLVDRARVRADAENRDHISLANWKEFLSIAWGELYTMLVDSGLRYFESEDTITATGASSYALPSDFFQSIGVDRDIDGTRREALTELMVQERNLLRQTGTALSYAIIGTNVELFPTPGSGTYYHVYVPQPADISANADATNVDTVTPDGENFVINHMAAIALAREEADATFAISERERARENFKIWAAERSMNSPRRRQVQDSYSRRDAADFWEGTGGWWW